MAWATPTTITSGQTAGVSTAFNTIANDLIYMGAAWNSYTPVWTASGTAPNLSNGTATGRYLQLGKIVIFRLIVTMGSSTTFGSGAYSVSLPVTAVNGGQEQLCDGMCADSSTGLYYRGIGRISANAATVSRCMFSDGASSTAGWAASTPFTWASGDFFVFTGLYEGA